MVSSASRASSSARSCCATWASKSTSRSTSRCSTRGRSAWQYSSSCRAGRRKPTWTCRSSRRCGRCSLIDEYRWPMPSGQARSTPRSASCTRGSSTASGSSISAAAALLGGTKERTSASMPLGTNAGTALTSSCTNSITATHSTSDSRQGWRSTASTRAPWPGPLPCSSGLNALAACASARTTSAPPVASSRFMLGDASRRSTIECADMSPFTREGDICSRSTLSVPTNFSTPPLKSAAGSGRLRIYGCSCGC